MTMERRNPEGWERLFQQESSKPYFKKLMDTINAKYDAGIKVYPKRDDIFAAYNATRPENVRVVVLGQDPYHEFGQANGLSFSVNEGIKLPPSLRNIFKELESDVGIKPTTSGDLTRWAKQGVLMLNTCLTVEDGRPGSHRGIGWEIFTTETIKYINTLNQPIVFILWGADAQKKIAEIGLRDSNNKKLITSAHPSPFSSYRGFFGSKPFSKANEFLKQNNVKTINW